ncbi:MAG: hypothetical protein IJV33_09925 [Bacteroidaceae bacterium]|nr:hypothetical protein [Bacteroidaceae bacterium]
MKKMEKKKYDAPKMQVIEMPPTSICVVSQGVDTDVFDSKERIDDPTEQILDDFLW